jgi:hypothetical protein
MLIHMNAFRYQYHALWLEIQEQTQYAMRAVNWEAAPSVAKLSDSMSKGLFRELNPGPLAPEARIIPLDQTARWEIEFTIHSVSALNEPLRKWMRSEHSGNGGKSPSLVSCSHSLAGWPTMFRNRVYCKNNYRPVTKKTSLS